ncbi:MAG: molecular chaperone HtpG [Hyphomicrobiaceae bacterium]
MQPEAGQGAAQHSFQTEVARLLHLMIHSVYTDKEIFLRELISNASDACDKLRYEAIATPSLLGQDARLVVTISVDKDARTLTIADNGIGMSETELIENLGTIARSGTRAFLDKLAGEGGGGSATSLIGQFGVGFYSAFMVADRIEVVSRKAGSADAHIWTSDGASGFTIAPAPAERAAQVPRGTCVTLHLKADADDFLAPHDIERIVRTYSDHILFPVELAEEGKSRQINSASALWQRSRSEVKPEEYKEVYNAVAGQFDEPAVTLHYRAEGRQSYAVLLYVPTEKPFDLFDVSRKGRVKLYVRRVYITDDADLLPSYLRFVRGVVDSEDLPLNVSREMLQTNPVVTQMRKAVTGRVVGELESIAEKEPERFAKIWETFGSVVKEGIYEDFERRDQLLKLARFRSSKGDDARSLAAYVADMRPGQDEIYYVVGESLERAKASPQLEAAAARGVEVLLLTDPVDSFWTSMPVSFEGKKLRSLSQGDVDLSAVTPAEDEPKEEEAAPDIAGLIAQLKPVLADAVSDVRTSSRLVQSPACLVAQGAGPDLALDRMLQRSQRGGGSVKPVLELNPRHALVKAAVAHAAAGHAAEVGDIGQVLLDQARVLDGEVPADPAGFVERINRLITQGLAKA